MGPDNNNLALALAGIITQVSDADIETTTDNDKYDVDVGVEDSFNHELDVEDSLNSDDDGNFSENSWDSSIDVSDSLNGNGDNRDNQDNGNNRDNDYSTDTDVDVEVADSLNDNGNFRDNDFSHELNLDLDKSFELSDDDVIDLDCVSGLQDVLGAGGDLLSNAHGVAVFGDGNAFDIDQVNNLSDQDVLNNPSVANNAPCFSQDGWADGGHSDADSSWGDAGEGARVAADAASSADGALSNEAFTQNIVMGANIQYNSIDMSVVGGGGAGDAIGDEA